MFLLTVNKVLRSISDSRQVPQTTRSVRKQSVLPGRKRPYLLGGTAFAFVAMIPSLFRA